MKVRFEAPQNHLGHILHGYGFDWTDNRTVAEILIPNPTEWVELDEYPHLKLIATPSTGTNHIDLKECERRGIEVVSLLNNRDALEEIKASSEFTFMLILLGLRHGAFRQWKSYSRNDDVMRGRELYGKEVEIIGYGRIGRNIWKWCKAFGARPSYVDPQYNTRKMEHAFARADIVVVSCALTDETRSMIDKRYLDLLKPDALVVNTARAEVFNEKDLIKWVKKRKGTYVTDVLHNEVEGNVQSELLEYDNCIVTPHLAGVTQESNEKAARIILDLVQDWKAKCEP